MLFITYRVNQHWRVRVKRKSKKKIETLIKAKEDSLEETKGVPKYSGSSYNGQGNVDHGKITSNKKRR